VTRQRALVLLAALGVQLAVLAGVAAPRLVVRVTGTEYRLSTRPVDPIDPLRGAYVDLELEGLQEFTEQRGTVYVTLTPAGPRLLRGSQTLDRKPENGAYLRCDAGEGGEVSCGIESFFASQEEARRLAADARDRRLVARVRVGLGGRAVLVGLE